MKKYLNKTYRTIPDYVRDEIYNRLKQGDHYLKIAYDLNISAWSVGSTINAIECIKRKDEEKITALKEHSKPLYDWALKQVKKEEQERKAEELKRFEEYKQQEVGGGRKSNRKTIILQGLFLLGCELLRCS